MINEMAMDTLWVLLATMLVFFMNLGFAALESGFARSKNTVNILSKNLWFLPSQAWDSYFGLGIDVWRRQSCYRYSGVMDSGQN